jgi:hypothetical protein
MALTELRRLLEPFPYGLRTLVLDYARSVEASAPEIYIALGLSAPTGEQLNQFTAAVGVRKLWSVISGQREMVRASFDNAFGAESVRIAARTYGPDSDDYAALSLLVQDLQQALASIFRDLRGVGAGRGVPAGTSRRRVSTPRLSRLPGSGCRGVVVRG